MSSSSYVELVEMSDGNVVAVGPFPDADTATTWARHIEYGGTYIPGLVTSRGGVRLLSVTALARELGTTRATLTPPKEAPPCR